MNGLFDNVTFANNNASADGGALYFKDKITNVTVKDARFENNDAQDNGGAIYVYGASDSCTFENTAFINNTAETQDGGAINFHLALLDGVFDHVTFINNTGRNGGAVNMDRTVESILFNDIRFIDNVARDNGGAFYVLYPINLVTFNNTFFINNVAETEDGGAINFHGVSSNVTFDNVVFRNNSGRNGGAIYVNSDVVNTKITNSEFKDNFADSATNNMAINGDGAFILENVDPENLGPFYVAYLTVNITDSIVYGETVEIIAIVEKEDQNPLNAGIVSISVNGKNQTANVENGTAKFTISNLNAGSYKCVASYYNGVNYTNPTQSADFTVSRQNATIAAKNAAYVINYNGKYSVVLTDTKGKLRTGKKVTFTLNGKNIGSASTDVNGIATITLTAKILKAAKAGNKDLLIECSDLNYVAVSKTVKITINKEKTKLAAKNIKFKKAKKVKKYTVTLKAKGKAIKGVKVTLKIKGKTYNAKTNKKGKATFKIKKLTKKGKHKATVKFAGNAYYKGITKKVTIRIK